MCHSDPDRAENGFLLTTRAGLLRGGERRPGDLHLGAQP